MVKGEITTMKWIFWSSVGKGTCDRDTATDFSNRHTSSAKSRTEFSLSLPDMSHVYKFSNTAMRGSHGIFEAVGPDPLKIAWLNLRPATPPAFGSTYDMRIDPDANIRFSAVSPGQIHG